jgi:hypothetical protein
MTPEELKAAGFSDQEIANYKPIPSFDLTGADAEKGKQLVDAGFNEREIADYFTKNKPSGDVATEKQPEGFSFSKMAGNIIPSGVEFFKNMITPLLPDPKDKPSFLGGIASGFHPLGMAKKIVEPIAKTGLGFVEKLIPGDQEHERYADSMIDYFAKRYGGVDQLLATIQNDPTGFAADVSTVLGGTGALAQTSKVGWLSKLGKGTEVAGRVTNPVTAPLEAAGGIRSLLGRTSLPESLYEKTLKIPPASVSQEKRASILDTMVRKEALPLGKQTRDKMTNIVAKLDDKITEILDGLSQGGSEININTLSNAMDNLKVEFKNRPNHKEIIRVIDDVKKDFIEHNFVNQRAIQTQTMTPSVLLDPNGRPFMVPSTVTTMIPDNINLLDAHNLKKGTYSNLETFYKKAGQPESGRVGIKSDFDAAANARAARTLRDAVLTHPDTPIEVRSLLKREAGLMEARKWVERATNRGGNLDPAGLGSMAFGILVDKGVPGAVAYRIAMSQPVMSRFSLFLAHGSKGATALEKVAMPTSLGLYNMGRIPQ